MLERKKASPPHDDTSRSGLFGAPAALPPDAQWTPLPDPSAARFWNASIAPHASAPSGSSVTLDVQASAFDLGVYNVASADIRGRDDDNRQELHVPPFQSSSSSLSRALSPPQVSSCSSPHNFYAYSSPNHEQVTTENITAGPRENAPIYHSNDENYMEIDPSLDFHEIAIDNFDVQPFGQDSAPEHSNSASAPPPLPLTNPPPSLSSSGVAELPTQEALPRTSGPAEAVPNPVQPDTQDPAPSPKANKPSATRRVSEINKPPPRLSSHLPATSESVISHVYSF